MFVKEVAVGLMLLSFGLFAGCDSDNSTNPGNQTNFTVTIENISKQYGVTAYGTFAVPVGSGGPGPLVTGNAYEFDFEAAPGSQLSFATMFVQSNDLFYAPGEAGIDLFDGSGNQLTGDITAQVQLWDAGTEENEKPGFGPNQAPRQSGADTGANDSDNTVRLVNDGYSYPQNSEVMRVTLTSTSATGFRARIENTSNQYQFPESKVFNTPADAVSPGPIVPGGAYEITFNAAPGHKLSFATMFVPSNDFFYAPDENGIDLFDGSGNPVTGDVTSQIQLWDAGTEIDQEPGLGADQPQRSGGTGAVDPDNTVRFAADTFGNLPAISDVIKATLSSTSATSFVLRIENVSNDSTLLTSDGGKQFVPMTPGVIVVHNGASPLFTSGEADRGQGLEAIAEDGIPTDLGNYLESVTGINFILSPGAWAVHSTPGPLFTIGQTDRDEGLEALAEDGNPAELGTSLSTMTGITSPFAPGVFVVHDSGMPLFTDGQADRGEGLEALAEDGDPSGLQTSLGGNSDFSEVGVFNTPTGASAPGPLMPGGAYQFTFSAEDGQFLSFATMYVQSNDLFVAPADAGLALFSNGTPLSGDITSELDLWDAGTEINEAPGVGLNQAPRQAGPNTGTDENGSVRIVNDGFTYSDLASILRVTITPQ